MEQTGRFGRWRVSLTLPDAADVNRPMWDDWRKAVEDTELPSLNHLFGYAGLKFIKQHGEIEAAELTAAETTLGGDIDETWIPLPLAEMQSWERRGKEERTMLISWIGLQLRRWVETVTDPKG